jgi:hypothetical protein
MARLWYARSLSQALPDVQRDGDMALPGKGAEIEFAGHGSGSNVNAAMDLLAIFRTQATGKPALPAGALAVRSACELLAPLQAQIEAIERLIGVPRAHWSRLYAPLLDGYASFVQDLPVLGREEGRSCLLTRGIEAMGLVLKLRRSMLLPSGAGAETIAREQDLWTFAAATSALLRTLAQSLPLHVMLYDPHGRVLGPWVPWVVPLGRSGAAWYVARRGKRSREELHRRAAPLLARALLPEECLRWLASNLEVFNAWLAAIVDDREAAGVLGDLLARVDAALESEAPPLTKQPETMAPLRPADRLLRALQRLLDEGALPLNDERASGWLVGEALWLVADRTLGVLRDALSASAERDVTHTDQELLAALKREGLLMLDAGAPLWTAEVRGEGWACPREETLLCLSVPRIWRDPAGRLAAFTGSVIPIRGARRVEGEPEPAAKRSAPSGDTAKPRAEEGAEGPRPGLAPHAAGISRSGRTEVLQANPGRLFLDWLRRGLASGELAMNAPAGRVHVVPEGLLLVSPALFQDFALIQDFDRGGWRRVQSSFERLKLHRMGEQGASLRTYESEAPGGASGVIQGLLIPEPQEAFSGVIFPSANPRLRLMR